MLNIFVDSHGVDENHNIRVADFGLAKDIYITEYYRGDKLDALPVKWMALESLEDFYFDEKTDVVSVVHIYNKKSRNFTYKHCIICIAELYRVQKKYKKLWNKEEIIYARHAVNNEFQLFHA